MDRLFNKRYVPSALTKKDRKRQARMINRSKKLYRQGKYYTRKKVSSFRSKPSGHVEKAKRIYGVDRIGATSELAKKSGCSVGALRKIINKGQGAYFSSGSRPNQTGQSWGVARLASALTAGKAAAVDIGILEKGCSRGSRALRMAHGAVRRYGHGTRRVPKTRV